MRALSPAEVLSVWEAGGTQHALDRALTLLAAATGTSRAELADLPIGERDARLFRLRALMLGPAAAGFAACPKCGEPAEFSVDTEAFTTFNEKPAPVGMTHPFTLADAPVRFRLPTSRDLAAAVVAAPDARRGLERLVERCVVTADGGGDLPLETVEAVGRAMVEADPQAEILLALDCPGCGKAWQMIFDVAAFFWDELAAQAQRLLREIDAIARAYGWTECEILGLSARRRQSYLAMLGA